MMKNILSILLLVSGSFLLSANASTHDEVCKQTYIYSIKGTDTLRLDKYDVPSCQADKPCVIFMFGGSFRGGTRDGDRNAAYLKELAKSGYVAVGIDYRLGLKDLDASKVSDINEVVNLLQYSIFIAVEDLFDATRFAYERSDEWKINKEMIVANGSSAGAIAVLQGEYLISNHAELTQKLPDNFCYAGIIAFAGAVFSATNELTWPTKSAPMQLFHGDADKNVPYYKAEIAGTGGLYGSKYIAEQLKDQQVPYYFYDVINAAHEVSSDPMSENLEDIRAFITKYVINKDPLIIHLQSRQIGKPDMKKDFTIMDYLQTNYM